MARPGTRQELVEYALRRLGDPVIKINVDDEQIEDLVDDAIQYIQEYHFDAIHRTFFQYQLTEQDIQNEYIPVPEEVMSIVGIFPQRGISTGSIFDFTYQFTLHELYTYSHYDLQYYDSFKRYSNMLSQMLRPEQSIRFNRVMDRIYIDGRWSRFAAGQWMVFDAYIVLNPNAHQEIYNNILLKKYLTALIKRQWGVNLSKFDGIQLIGGVTMNGQQILDQANQEIEKIEEDMQLYWQGPDAFFVG